VPLTTGQRFAGHDGEINMPAKRQSETRQYRQIAPRKTIIAVTGQSELTWANEADPRIKLCLPIWRVRSPITWKALICSSVTRQRFANGRSARTNRSSRAGRSLLSLREL